MIKSEKIADRIARKLVRVLCDLENFNDDPEIVLDSAAIEAHSKSQGVREAVQILWDHYAGHN